MKVSLRIKIIITTSILISCVLFFKNLTKKNIAHIKIAYSYFENINELDPVNINDIYQANLIENLYDRMFEYDNDGNLICNLCSSYNVKNDLLRFNIRTDLKTVDNYLVKATDVADSLKRLVKTRSNTHGELKYFIENEDSIYTEDESLVIKLKKPEYFQFIVPILTSMDYSIILTKTISKENKITDFKNTTGPYYVESQNDQNVVLVANPNHFKFSEKMPQRIEIIRTQNQDAIEKFENNEIDIVDVTMFPRSSRYRKLFKDKKIDFKSFQTLPMNLLYLGISPRARQHFSKDELFYACKIIREEYIKFDTFGYGYVDAYQFFLGSGNGQLDEKELSSLVFERNKEINYKKLETIKFGVLERSFDKVKKAFEKQAVIEVVSYKSDPAFLAPNKQPDLFIQTTDSSFIEDINVISYNLNSGNFGLDKAASEEWMQDYLRKSSKRERIEMIKSLQNRMLNQPALCPLVVSPYWAVYKKEYELNFPTQFPGSHWWKIRKL